MLSMFQGLFRESVGLGTALVGLIVIVTAFLSLAAWVVERKEYVLEQ
jgi:hypothetical protein